MSYVKTCTCTICKKDYLCRYDKGICKECRREMKFKKRILNNIENDISDRLDGSTKWDRRYNSALEIISKQVDIVDYQNELNSIYANRHLFGSMPEVVFAFALVSNKINYIPQRPIGKYKADFYCPEHKIILEVDGSIYHQDLQKEAERDFCIIRVLGSDWRIFHIPDNVAKNIAKSRYYIKSIIEGGNNDNQTGKC